MNEPTNASDVSESGQVESAATDEAVETGGLQAGPLRMAIAGLIAGGLLAAILAYYPFFYPPPMGGGSQREISAEELAQQEKDGREADLKNVGLTGLMAGLLLALGCGLGEAASRRSVGSMFALPVAIIVGAAVGAGAGVAASRFQMEFRFAAMEPMTRTIAVQLLFWGLLGGGIGLGMGAFVRRPGLMLGIVLQGMLGGVLFAILYVPLASFLFAVDDAERVVPPSLANQATWAVLGLLMIALMLGFARQRKRVPANATQGA